MNRSHSVILCGPLCLPLPAISRTITTSSRRGEGDGLGQHHFGEETNAQVGARVGPYAGRGGRRQWRRRRLLLELLGVLRRHRVDAVERRRLERRGGAGVLSRLLVLSVLRHYGVLRVRREMPQEVGRDEGSVKVRNHAPGRRFEACGNCDLPRPKRTSKNHFGTLYLS